MKKSLKIVMYCSLALIVALTFAMSGCDNDTADKREVTYLPEGITALQKEEGEDFKIMLFTDIQLWMNFGDNKKVYYLMDRLVAAENPDLIILPGDNVSGIFTRSLTTQLIERMEAYKIPWAPVYGNHDEEGVASRKWQSEQFEKAPHCLFERGGEEMQSGGNYAVNIVEGERIIETLFMLDNSRYHKYDDGGKREVYIDPKQIEWFEETVDEIKDYQGQIVPSMTFSHFAMPEMLTAVETLCEKGDDGKYRVPEGLGYGYCAYLPGVAPINTGFVDKAKALGTTHMFFGHDHENNASIDFEGIRYTYGLKTGCSPRYWNSAEVYGATIVTIGESVTVYNCEME